MLTVNWLARDIKERWNDAYNKLYRREGSRESLETFSFVVVLGYCKWCRRRRRVVAFLLDSDAITRLASDASWAPSRAITRRASLRMNGLLYHSSLSHHTPRRKINLNSSLTLKLPRELELP